MSGHFVESFSGFVANKRSIDFKSLVLLAVAALALLQGCSSPQALTRLTRKSWRFQG
jgi:hypothetical protein